MLKVYVEDALRFGDGTTHWGFPRTRHVSEMTQRALNSHGLWPCLSLCRVVAQQTAETTLFVGDGPGCVPTSRRVLRVITYFCVLLSMCLPLICVFAHADWPVHDGGAFLSTVICGPSSTSRLKPPQYVLDRCSLAHRKNGSQPSSRTAAPQPRVSVLC